MFFICQYHDPRTWDLVYIGLTDNLERRMKQHLLRSDSPLYPLAAELRSMGLQLHSSILDSHTDLEAAKQLEKKYIQEKKPILNTIYNMVSDIDKTKSTLAAIDENPTAVHYYQDDEGELVERRERRKPKVFTSKDVQAVLEIDKRATERYSFEIYSDQKEDIQQVCNLYEQATGKKLSASRLIREVLDTFLPDALKTFESSARESSEE